MPVNVQTATEYRYTEFPPITIGGLTGDYFIVCPTTSCEWAEYCVDVVVNGDGGTGAVVISSNSKPLGLDYTGASTSQLNNDNRVLGWPVRIAATTTQVINSSWTRITNSEKKVYLRIDAAASTSIYVTIRFRIAKLLVVPGPSVTVHPEHEAQMNIARADMTDARLNKMGIPRYATQE